MPDGARITWVPFYEELADKLLAYKGNRAALVDEVVRVYRAIGLNLPRLDSTPVPADIDPYTVYGLFNKGISDANRRKVAAGLARGLDVRAPQPRDFGGVPLLNNLNATFYAFSGDAHRREGDVDRLWDLFEAELALAAGDTPQNRARFSALFDATVHQYGLGWKLTMGLYWARPRRFISLDSRNRWYMGDQALAGARIAAAVPCEKGSSVPTGERYLAICDFILAQVGSAACPPASLPALSLAAWEESERVNHERKAARKAAEAAAEENALGDADIRPARCWLYAPGEGASMWDDFRGRGIMALGWRELGDLGRYADKESMRRRLLEAEGAAGSQRNSALAAWQFSREMEPGDVVFAKRGLKQIIGRGVVEGEYAYDPAAGAYPHIRKVRWTHAGAWDVAGQLPLKTLTDITDSTDLLNRLNGLFDDADSPMLPEPAVDLPVYTKEDFLAEAYLDEGLYDRIVRQLRRKKNVVLQGPPGVGKTFVAKRLAYSAMGVKDPSRVELVQFHQSYSYEDFVEGYRPTEQGFEVQCGVFREFCAKAADDPERDYFFIIDEINRGNLSRIFGELFMLIEADKRGERNKLRLLYSHDAFFVPGNLYLIGMMNTADRSLALVDYALRRRFAFFDLEPAFGSEGFAAYREGLGSPALDRLAACIDRLNAVISADEALGDGFRIGHSYLCGLTAEDIGEGRLSDIVDYELVPLLREYWFDDPENVRDWTAQLRAAVR